MYIGIVDLEAMNWYLQHINDKGTLGVHGRDEAYE
jgi:hypothetical protein